MNHRPCRLRLRRPIARLGLACVLLLTSLVTAPLALSQTDSAAPAPAPVEVEIVQESGGLFDGVSDFLMDFQRRANAEVALHMNAIERGDNLGALILALAVAFAYGAIHAFGPGHGKFVVVSYFLGREARVMRGVVMALQIAIVHVIAAIVIVWLADLVLRGGFGLGLSDVPRVRAELPHHRRHRPLHAVSGRARLAESTLRRCQRPRAQPWSQPRSRPASSSQPPAPSRPRP